MNRDEIKRDENGQNMNRDDIKRDYNGQNMFDRRCLSHSYLPQRTVVNYRPFSLGWPLIIKFLEFYFSGGLFNAKMLYSKFLN